MGRNIAYQVFGEGPIDLIGVTGMASMDAEWAEPEIAHFNRRLAELCRCIRFDDLGSGASDPPPELEDHDRLSCQQIITVRPLPGSVVVVVVLVVDEVVVVVPPDDTTKPRSPVVRSDVFAKANSAEAEMPCIAFLHQTMRGRRDRGDEQRCSSTAPVPRTSLACTRPRL